MKKYKTIFPGTNLSLAIASIAIVLAGCEKQVPVEQNTAVESEYLFNQSVRIYDESKLNYVDYMVRCDDEKNFMDASECLEKSTLELISPEQKKSLHAKNQNNQTEQEDGELEQQVHAKPDLLFEEVGRSFTNSGYKIGIDQNSLSANNNSKYYVNQWGVVTVQGWASDLSIVNASPTVLGVQNYYYNGSAWTYTFFTQLNYDDENHNTPGGYAPKRCVVSPVSGPTVFYWYLD